MTGQFLEKIWPGTPVEIYWILVVGGVLLMIYAGVGALRERWGGVIRLGLYVPLPDAARLAFEKAGGAEIFKGDAASRLKYHAIDILVDAREHNIKIFGVRPPSRRRRIVPPAWLEPICLGDDLESIRDREKPERIEWERLCVYRLDLNYHINRRRGLVLGYKLSGGKMSDEAP